jgi:hypothetical protein
VSENFSLHRRLDELFAGLAMTPDLQDLKEEIRGNLTARVQDLEAAGAEPTRAVESAIAELGDITELVDAALPSPRDSRGNARGQSVSERTQAALTLNRARPKPAFVVRTVAFSVLLAAILSVLVLGMADAIDVAVVPLILLGIVAAVLSGMVAADSLHQETSQHFPMSSRRALGFGGSAGAMALGLALVAVFLFETPIIPLVIAGTVLLFGSVVGFSWLGVTQTNRTKPWVREMQRDHTFPDRFSEDPAAAARFGVYTVVLWTLAITAFVVLSIVVGFAWSWIALLLGFAIFMLVLARMLFGAGTSTRPDSHPTRAHEPRGTPMS